MRMVHTALGFRTEPMDQLCVHCGATKRRIICQWGSPTLSGTQFFSQADRLPKCHCCTISGPTTNLQEPGERAIMATHIRLSL